MKQGTKSYQAENKQRIEKREENNNVSVDGESYSCRLVFSM